MFPIIATQEYKELRMGFALRGGECMVQVGQLLGWSDSNRPVALVIIQD